MLLVFFSILLSAIRLVFVVVIAFIQSLSLSTIRVCRDTFTFCLALVTARGIQKGMGYVSGGSGDSICHLRVVWPLSK